MELDTHSQRSPQRCEQAQLRLSKVQDIPERHGPYPVRIHGFRPGQRQDDGGAPCLAKGSERFHTRLEDCGFRFGH